MSCDFAGPDYVDLTSSSDLVCPNYFSLTSSCDLQVHATLLYPRPVIWEECGEDDAWELFSWTLVDFVHNISSSWFRHIWRAVILHFIN